VGVCGYRCVVVGFGLEASVDVGAVDSVWVWVWFLWVHVCIKLSVGVYDEWAILIHLPKPNRSHALDRHLRTHS